MAVGEGGKFRGSEAFLVHSESVASFCATISLFATISFQSVDFG